MKNFDKVGLIKQSWEIVKRNVQIIVLLMGVFVLYSFVQSFVVKALGESFISSLVSLAFTLGSIFLQIGFIKIVLKIVDGQKADIQQLWAYPQYFLRAVVVTIVMGLAIGIGLILLIIPGVYLALRLQFALYFLVDKDMAAMDSLKASWKATEGNILNLFFFMLLLIGINILGAVALLVGLLITIPISFVAVSLLYRKLSA